MRVITGSAKGHRLLSLKGTDTRPTSESVKETMMSAIQFEISGAKVLDLFAGTGQLGIEALSRGAKFCQFVDYNKRCGLLIEDNLKHTKLEDSARVTVANVHHWILSAPDVYDIVFIDPPYNEDHTEKLLPNIIQHLHPDGVLVCEIGVGETLPQSIDDFSQWRSYSHGKKTVIIYRKS